MSASIFPPPSTAFFGESPWSGLSEPVKAKAAKKQKSPGAKTVMRVSAKEKQLPKPRPKSEIGIRLRALIDKNAATAEGFMAEDAKGDLLPRSAHKICNHLFNSELLFKVRVLGSTTMRFFCSIDLANAFHASQLAARKPMPATVLKQKPVKVQKKPTIIWHESVKVQHIPAAPPRFAAVDHLLFQHGSTGAMKLH